MPASKTNTIHYERLLKESASLRRKSNSPPTKFEDPSKYATLQANDAQKDHESLITEGQRLNKDRSSKLSTGWKRPYSSHGQKQSCPPIPSSQGNKISYANKNERQKLNQTDQRDKFKSAIETRSLINDEEALKSNYGDDVRQHSNYRTDSNYSVVQKPFSAVSFENELKATPMYAHALSNTRHHLSHVMEGEEHISTEEDGRVGQIPSQCINLDYQRRSEGSIKRQKEEL